MWYSRSQNKTVATQCIDPPQVDTLTSAVVLTFCWRRECITNGAALMSDDIELSVAKVPLPDRFKQASIGIALTIVKPSCAAESYAIGNPSDSATYKPIIFSMAETVTAPAGGLSSFDALMTASAYCDDTSGSIMLNAIDIKIVDIVRNMCPIHDTPLDNRACPYPKVLVILDIDADGDGKKDPGYASVLQCVDPANYDRVVGEMAISYCWSFGQLPDPFAHNPFIITMPDVVDYNIQYMPGGGGYNAVIGRPALIPVDVQLIFNPKVKGEKATVVTADGPATLPPSGAKSVTYVIRVPSGLDDQSVSVRMLGVVNPPPPELVCPCPAAVPTGGVCLENRDMITYSLVSDPTVKKQGCVLTPYWDPIKTELMWSHCWTYSCLHTATDELWRPRTDGAVDTRFDNKDYFIDLEWTTKYNLDQVPAGNHRLDFFKPKIIDMFLRFKYNAFSDPSQFAEFAASANTPNITVPPGGIRQMAVRFKIPYNMKVDMNSASVNLNADPARKIVAPPPLPPKTNYTRNVTRNGAVLSSSIYIADIKTNADLDIAAVSNKFSKDIQGKLSDYLLTLDIAFPDYSYVKGCTPDSQQKVLNDVAAKLQLSPDQLTMTCTQNYVKSSNTQTTAASGGTGRHLMQTTADGKVICKPRVSISVSVPLGSDNTTISQNAATAADGMNDVMGNSSCYVPTASEGVVGTVVQYQTTSLQVNCSYMVAAFAASNNLTEDQARLYQCQEQQPKDDDGYSAGMIALFVISGVLGVVLIIVAVVLVVTYRRKRRLQYVGAAGQLSGAAITPAGKVHPSAAMGGPHGDPETHHSYRRGAVAEGIEDAMGMDPLDAMMTPRRSANSVWTRFNRVAPDAAALRHAQTQ